MGSLERSKKKVQLWKKAIVHFLLCFVMGFFTGFAPTGKGTTTTSMFSTKNNIVSNQTSLNMLHHTILENRESFKKSLSDETSTSTTTVTLQWSKSNETSQSEDQEKGVVVEERQDQDQDQETEEEGNDEFLNPRRLLIIVTPTNAKDQNRGMLLQRLSNTLRLIPQPILWIVVEQQIEDSKVSEILRKTGIMYRHLVFKENFTKIDEEVDHQRNVALNHIEHHRLSGIVHFASLSNVYDLTFFDELRAIEGFGTWPMALLSTNTKNVIIEGPVCDSSEVMGWHLKKSSNNSTDDNERPSIRVSNFAFNTSILWDPERWGRTSSIQDTSQDSLKFVRKEVLEDETKLMGIPPDDCSKILLWNFPLST